MCKVHNSLVTWQGCGLDQLLYLRPMTGEYNVLAEVK